MKHLTIVDTEGNSHTFNLADTLSEVPLNNKIAYDTCNEDIALWLKSALEDETLMENRTYYLYLLSKAIGEFIGYPLYEVLKFNAEDLVDDYGELLPNVLESHFNKLGNDYKIDFDNVEANLENIYFYIDNLCKSYEFKFKGSKDFEMDHAGCTWEIPYVVKKLYSGKNVFSKVSIGQSVEILKIKSNLAKLLKEPRDLTSTQKIKDFRFSSFLKVISCTVRKKGEPIPLDDTEYQHYVTENMTKFQDIDTQTAYDIIFFLTTIMKS